jgi:hypothetical protein
MVSLPLPSLLARVEEALASTVRASFFKRAKFHASRIPRRSSRNAGRERPSIAVCQPKLTVVVKHLSGSKMLRHATVRGFAPSHIGHP